MSLSRWRFTPAAFEGEIARGLIHARLRRHRKRPACRCRRGELAVRILPSTAAESSSFAPGRLPAGGGRKHPSAQKIDHSPNFRRGMPAGGPEHVEYAGAFHAIGQNGAQASIRQRFPDREFRQIGDAQALKSKAHPRLDVVADHRGGKLQLGVSRRLP